MAEIIAAPWEVKSVAFGECGSDFFVVFEDGRWINNGCPGGLMSLMEDRNNKKDLDKVSLGPDGEWFVRAKNGRTWFGDVSDELNRRVQMIRDKGGCITDTQFGKYGAYFIRYRL